MSLRHSAALLLLLVSIGQSYSATQLLAQGSYPTPIEMYSANVPVGQEFAGTSQTSNQMLWQQYQTLQMADAPGSEAYGASGECQTCSGSGATDYSRCGCNSELFPWINGPGNCDQWCVGPRWGVEAAGLFFFRENADFASVTNSLVAADATTANQLVEQFDHGPGVRLFATAYNETGYGLQIGYEGINDWIASAVYSQDAAVGTDPDITRTTTYQTRFNSLEINALSPRRSTWQLFSGFRYVEFDEDFSDRPLRNAAATNSASNLLIDTGSSHFLENRLFGFQLGSRREAWNIGNRLSIEAFANAGVYCNNFRRDDLTQNTTTIIVEDDIATLDTNEFSQTTSTSTQTSRRQTVNKVAFLGEAGVSGVWQLNPCFAVRGGYQILAVDGVGQGLDAFLTPGGGLDGTTLVYHGVQLGVEYRR